MAKTFEKILLHANPPHPIGPIGSLGDLSVRHVSHKTMQDFAGVDDDHRLAAAALTDWLISKLVSKSDQTALTAEDIRDLSVVDRDAVAEALISYNASLFAQTGRVDDEPAIEREAGECAQNYLARGFRVAYDRHIAGGRRLIETVRKQTLGLSDRLKAQLLPGLTANRAASDQLGKIIGAGDRRAELAELFKSGTMSSAERLAGFTTPSYTPLEIPDLPPHPALETNALLSEVSQKIGTMHAIAEATAAMQRSLNDTAATALTEFSKGAEASSKSAADGLSMAMIGLLVAGVTALLTLAAIIVAIVLAHAQSRDSADRDRASATQTRALIASDNRLAAALEDHSRVLRAAAAREKARRERAVAHGGSHARRAGAVVRALQP